MFVAESFKGNQTIYSRDPRKRGGMGDKRTLEDKITVLIVVDKNGGITDFVLDEHCRNDIYEVMYPIVNHDSILCSDGAHACKTSQHKTRYNYRQQEETCYWWAISHS
ncbi:MAG: hypothetical protein ACJAU4_000820 [Glaciecola sp.]|jgi:hypothetical protein